MRREEDADDVDVEVGGERVKLKMRSDRSRSGMASGVGPSSA